MAVNRSLVLLLTLIISLTARAEIYKWTDANGKSHFSGSKPAESATVESRNDLQIKSARPETEVAKPVAAAPKVELYITKWCPYCKKAMAFLRQNNIAFTAYDIEQDLDAAERKKTLDPRYEGVPLAVINNSTIRGFSEYSYRQALAMP